jgi:hypothetical protein
MWLGRITLILGYRASCRSGPPTKTRPYVWDKLKCTETGDYEVKITW